MAGLRLAAPLRYAALLGAFAAAVLPVAAAAAEFRVLHVRALSVTVDRMQGWVARPLHLTVRAVVGARVDALPELILPDLTAFQVLADSERIEHSTRGTTFTAVLTIAPNLPGRAVIGPAYLDALDPRTGRGMRYRSGTVTVSVLAAPPGEAQRMIAQVHRLLPLDALFVLAVIVGALWLLRPRNAARVDRAAPLPLPGTPPPADTLGPWIQRLRDAPTRANAVAARAALWSRLGAPERATAQDVLSELKDPAGRGAVAAAERAAFVEPSAEARAARDFAEALAGLVR
ncbi:hypothetical protein EPN52_05650 [bacterium]|nr:MAG: hypothetical protein EPN52_05650 [bacterium]